MSSTASRIIRRIAFLVLGALISYLLRRGGITTDWFQTTLVTIGLFQLALAVDIALEVNSLHGGIGEIHGRERTAIEDAKRLLALRRDIHRLEVAMQGLSMRAVGQRDLFLAYFGRKIHALADEVETAEKKGQLRVVAEHFLYIDNVLDAFSGQEERIWRYVWLPEGGQPLFAAVHWRTYFRSTAEMAASGEIRAIRCLLVVEEVGQAQQDIRIKSLMRYYNGAKSISCKIISGSEFAKVKRDLRVQADHLDFGIYGNALLFRSEQFEPEIVGEFSTNRATIDLYTRMFDHLWNLGADGTRGLAKKDTITIDELMDADGTPR